ncbi:response regulator transcription factor [Blautia sp.]|uniref:response regulator transcription factor n=1 Tax=Blautia sp. TaxID=1955243 RepID=UPI00258685EC|nr:response regulator transcription factor [Blautia sp.]
MKKIVVIEDDKTLRRALAGLLEENGYQVFCVEDFLHAEEGIKEAEPDLVLLDIILPGTNGQEILRNLRKTSDLPVIMLTSKTGETDEILSMSYGADDYMTKPYNPALLLLKIEALFRRIQPQREKEELEYAGMRLNLLRSTLAYEERAVILSKNEMSVLHYLMKHQGNIVSRDELMDYLWDCNAFVDDNTLTVNINRLRKRMEEVGIFGRIETRRGQGYILI